MTHAQKVWEPISLQGLKWSDNPNLNITLNSRGDLEAWNSNTEKSKDDNWYKEIISMSIPSSIIDTIKNSERGAVRITFCIRNKHDEPNNNVYYVYSNKNLKLKRDRYTGVYWGYHIKFTEDDYLKRYFNDYCIKPSYSPTTLLRHRLYSSTNNLWLDQDYIGKQNVSIEICNESIKIFEDFDLIYYTSNTAIDELQIVVGSAALVVVEDLKVELLTLYGQAETYILTGNRDFDNGNYLDATDREFKIGENSNKSVEDIVSLWNNPIFDYKCLDRLKDFGINCIRIPVTWCNFIVCENKKDVFVYIGKGALAMLPAVLLIALASSINLVMQESGILDTIMNTIINFLENKSPLVCVLFIYLLILILQVFIGSASAKIFLVMPILLPICGAIGFNNFKNPSK